MTTNQHSALNLLSIYTNSDSDSENEVPGPKVSVKRCFKDENTPTKYLKTERLPVPSILKSAENNSFIDLPELHGGRIRSFPHEPGNWSTYIHIPYECNDVIEDLMKDIIAKCKPSLILQPIDDLHISLTKTVILRHHWIESFTKTVGEKLINTSRFLILFNDLKVYCNEDRSRTFIGLQIKTGHESLLNLIKILDGCLREFNLPEFYEDPSFHMSLVWCVGDYENVLNTYLEELNSLVSEYMANNPQYYWYIDVQKLICKTGNKYFNFSLLHLG